MLRHALLAILLAAAVVAFAPGASAGEADPVAAVKKKWAGDTYVSDRRELLGQLVELGTPEAREAIAWCAGRSREIVEAARRDAEKAAARMKPLQAEWDETFRKFLEQEAKKGNPNPQTRPPFPVDDKLNAARAALIEADSEVVEERAMRDAAVESHGRCVDRLPPAAQQSFRDAWAKGPLAAKDWPARAEGWEMLRHATAPWVAELAASAVAFEPDARALVPAIDVLGGRDPKVAVPPLAGRLTDVRWLVRAAALAALERTPCRESVDAVVARFPAEDGRLRDDCLRVLESLTGAVVARTPEAWTQWWAANRDKWTPPAKDDPAKAPTEKSLTEKAQKAGGGTGFFGIPTTSKRLCFLIDLSGSMNEKATDKGKETRAERAKTELVRAIRAMEDGSTFALVMYSDDVRIWKTEMTVAADDTRKAAVAWVESAPVVGATNTYDALEAAFSLGEPSKSKPSDPYADPKLDTIILLSDGKPTRGRTVKTDEIRAAVREWNKRRRVTVHAIAFGKDADFGFMEGLAKDTGGIFTAP